MAKDGSLKKVYNDWTLVGALTASGLPAVIYALQNILLQISYKNLDSLTFSILNQTKILFTAFFTYLILRYVLEWLLFQFFFLLFWYVCYLSMLSPCQSTNLLWTITSRSSRLRRCLGSFG